MNHPKLTLLGRILSRKLSVILLLAISAATAFATLGDGKTKSGRTNRSLLSDRTSLTPGSFSLKSGYLYRGNQVMSSKADTYINLNTVVSYQKGHTTYILPLKKRVILDKVTFNPNASSRRY